MLPPHHTHTHLEHEQSGIVQGEKEIIFVPGWHDVVFLCLWTEGSACARIFFVLDGLVADGALNIEWGLVIDF